MDKLIEKICYSSNISYFVGSAQATKFRRQEVIKNIIDIIDVQFKTLYSKDTNQRKERVDKSIKYYGCSMTNFFLFKLENDIFTYSSKETDKFKLFKMNNILTYISIIDFPKFESHLFLFDTNLNKTRSLILNQHVECHTITESKCYCIIYDKANKIRKLQIFDMNLKAIRTYESQRNTDPFCFSFKIAQILVKEEKIYLLKKDLEQAIIVMDENTGFIVQTFPFEAHSFSILNNDILYFINKQRDEICFSYLNGTIFQRSDLPREIKDASSVKISKHALMTYKGDISVYA
jgi:hypothetical protein